MGKLSTVLIVIPAKLSLPQNYPSDFEHQQTGELKGPQSLADALGATYPHARGSPSARICAPEQRPLLPFDPVTLGNGLFAKEPFSFLISLCLSELSAQPGQLAGYEALILPTQIKPDQEGSPRARLTVARQRDGWNSG